MDVDGNHIRIPNATVFKATIINYTRNPERRFSFELGIDADSALRDGAGHCPRQRLKALASGARKTPNPGAWIEKVGDFQCAHRRSGLESTRPRRLRQGKVGGDPHR